MTREDKSLHNIVGLKIEKARSIVEGSGWILRIAEEDGQPRCCTCDCRSNRLNVVIEKGHVKDILDIG